MKKEYTSVDKKLLKKIGNNIKTHRHLNDISQEDLALNCDLDRAYVGSVERGERNISILNLRKIAEALKTNIKELFNNSIEK